MYSSWPGLVADDGTGWTQARDTAMAGGEHPGSSITRAPGIALLVCTCKPPLWFSSRYGFFFSQLILPILSVGDHIDTACAMKGGCFTMLDNLQHICLWLKKSRRQATLSPRVHRPRQNGKQKKTPLIGLGFEPAPPPRGCLAGAPDASRCVRPPRTGRARRQVFCSPPKRSPPKLTKLRPSSCHTEALLLRRTLENGRELAPSAKSRLRVESLPSTTMTTSNSSNTTAEGGASCVCHQLLEDKMKNKTCEALRQDSCHAYALYKTANCCLTYPDKAPQPVWGTP
jgi:hypothetical protein